MRVLLDENLSPNLRKALHGHEIITAAYAGWSGLRNGALMRAAQDAGFEVFVTGDKNLAFQQNLEEYPLGIVVLSAHGWDIIEPHMPAIQAAVDVSKPGSVQFVDRGTFRR